jgi:hypothetical protein
MKIYRALFSLLSIGGVLFASGPYTPPPTPHADKAKKKDNKKKEDKNNKKDKDSKKGSQN